MDNKSRNKIAAITATPILVVLAGMLGAEVIGSVLQKFRGNGILDVRTESIVDSFTSIDRNSSVMQFGPVKVDIFPESRKAEDFFERVLQIALYVQSNNGYFRITDASGIKFDNYLNEITDAELIEFLQTRLNESNTNKLTLSIHINNSGEESIFEHIPTISNDEIQYITKFAIATLHPDKSIEDFSDFPIESSTYQLVELYYYNGNTRAEVLTEYVYFYTGNDSSKAGGFKISLGENGNRYYTLLEKIGDDNYTIVYVDPERLPPYEIARLDAINVSKEF